MKMMNHDVSRCEGYGVLEKAKKNGWDISATKNKLVKEYCREVENG